MAGFEMKALLFQLDGKLPNIALMRIAAHHRALGHEVDFAEESQSHNSGMSSQTSFTAVRSSNLHG